VTTHFGLMVLFSLFVSIAFATMMRDDVPGQLRLFGRLFAGFIGAGVILGWLLYPLPL
jgi:hypothetical protein